MEFVKKYIGLIVGVVVLAIYLIGFASPISDEESKAFTEFNTVDVHIGLAKWLVYALILLTVGFFIYKVIKNPAKGSRFFFGTLALGLLFLVFYFGASSDVSELSIKQTIEAGRYQLLGGMVATTIALIVLGALALVGFTIIKMIQDA